MSVLSNSEQPTRTAAALVRRGLVVTLLCAAAASAHAQDPRRTPVVQAVERAAPAVVSITTETPVNDPWAAFTGRRSNTGEGSGVVIDPGGVVLTNNHVVAGAQRITATFPDGTSYEAHTVGLAPDLDLAVLKLEDASGLVAVEIGTSDDLMLGEPTIAIGNPLGLGHTVTTGVVSAVHRSIETDRRIYQDFIQTDASINPGNSGGPLLNANGHMIGINTAIRRDGQNIGFAIPVDRAMKVAQDLLDFGTVRVPWLGCDLSDVSLRRGGGAARVSRVWTGGPASRAGLKAGDLVLEVDGRRVQGRGDLNAYLAGLPEGTAITLAVVRGDDELSVRMTGDELPSELVALVMEEVLGVSIGGRTTTGVLTVTPGGAFERAGILPGDLLIGVNGESIGAPSTFLDALSRAKEQHRDSALITIRRGPTLGRLTFPI